MLLKLQKYVKNSQNMDTDCISQIKDYITQIKDNFLYDIQQYP